MATSTLHLNEGIVAATTSVHTNANFNLTSTFLKLAAQSKYLDAEYFYKKYESDLPLFFKKNEHIVSQVLNRAEDTRRTLHDVEAESNSTEWTLGTTYLGISTHYKMSDDNLLTVKLEGVLDNVPLFDQANVIYEIDLFKTWMPLCSSSVKIDQINKSELAAYLRYKPPLGRDTLLHVYASDVLLSHDKVVLIGKSVDVWPPPAVTTSSVNNTTTNTTSPDTTKSTATVDNDHSSEGLKEATCNDESSSSVSQENISSEVTSGSDITYHNIYDIYAYDGIKFSDTDAIMPKTTTTSTTIASTTTATTATAATFATATTTTTTVSVTAGSTDEFNNWGLDDEEEIILTSNNSSSETSVGTPFIPFISRPIPWLLNSWFNKKMDIIDYRAVFTVLSPHQIQVCKYKFILYILYNIYFVVLLTY